MSERLRPVRERARRGAVGALVLMLGVVAVGVAAEALDAPDGLPLGSSRLDETRVDRVLAPGVRLTRISRGVKDGDDG